MQLTRSGLAFIVALCGLAGAGGAYLVTRSPAALDTTAAASGSGTNPAPSPAVDAPEPRAAAAAAVPDRGTARSTAPPTRPSQPPSAAVPASEAAGSSIGEMERSQGDSLAQTVPETASVVEPVAAAAPAATLTGTEPRELVIDRDAVLGVQLESTISSETARVEDRVVARVTRDVRVGDSIAVAVGSRVHGEVVAVERGGRLRERARLVVRFSSLSLPDGTRVDIATDPVLRDGESPSPASAAKIGGGAVGGAIIGGLLGGGKGAVLGGAAGAGAGTAATMAGDRSEAVLAAGTPVTIRLLQPVVIPVDR